MTTFLLEEVLPIVMGLFALAALWWVSADMQKRRRDDLTDAEHRRHPKDANRATQEEPPV